MNCLAVCSECGMKCFEKWTDYVSIEAYSFIAITGDNFCQGSWYGFLMKIKYLLEFQNAISISKFFMYSIKFIIIFCNVGTMIVMLYYIAEDSQMTSNIIYPIALNIWLTYITLGVVFSFFENVTFTMMICMAVDTDLTNMTQPEFGPAIFHVNMNIVKK